MERCFLCVNKAELYRIQSALHHASAANHDISAGERADQDSMPRAGVSARAQEKLALQSEAEAQRKLGEEKWVSLVEATKREAPATVPSTKAHCPRPPTSTWPGAKKVRPSSCLPPPFVHSFVTPASLLSPFPASLLQLPHLTNFQKLDLKFNAKFDLQKHG